MAKLFTLLNKYSTSFYMHQKLIYTNLSRSCFTSSLIDQEQKKNKTKKTKKNKKNNNKESGT